VVPEIRVSDRVAAMIGDPGRGAMPANAQVVIEIALGHFNWKAPTREQAKIFFDDGQPFWSIKGLERHLGVAVVKR